MRRTLMLVGVISLAVVTSAHAQQSRWSIELDAGAAIPTQNLAGADLQTGMGFGTNVRFRLQPHLSAYAGWEWHHFTTDQLVARDDVDVEDTGYSFGLRFEHPLVGRTLGWVRAGGIGNHIELENDGGDEIGDTKHGLGFELGGGLTLPLRERLALTPGVRYRSLSRDLEVGAATRSSTLSYVQVGMGVAWTF
ncbi:MAG TPA: outer membrane beta-barrel protein [Gemmatimonadaceae bacterium]|nr:outer membrane beta-barrel protein [Gemmatimonadaceae bacterium]